MLTNTDESCVIIKLCKEKGGAGMTEVQEKIKVFAVCGPTASGKTSLSVTLAKKLHAEVVSCD